MSITITQITIIHLFNSLHAQILLLLLPECSVQRFQWLFLFLFHVASQSSSFQCTSLSKHTLTDYLIFSLIKCANSSHLAQLYTCSFCLLSYNFSLDCILPTSVLIEFIFQDLIHIQSSTFPPAHCTPLFIPSYSKLLQTNDHTTYVPLT